MSKSWYVIQTHSNVEKKAKENLLKAIENKGLEDKFGEVLIPTEEVVAVHGTTQTIKERKFFPGYILVEMEMEDATWSLVNSVPKITRFLTGSVDTKGNLTPPLPLEPEELDNILNKMKGGEQPKPQVVYEPGETVMITDGPFNGFSGLVEEVDYEKSTLKVEVQIFGRSSTVSLSFGQINKG